MIELQAAGIGRKLQRFGGGGERVFVAALGAVHLGKQRPRFGARVRGDIGTRLGFGGGEIADSHQAVGDVDARGLRLRGQRQGGAIDAQRFFILAAGLQHDAEIVVIAAFIERVRDGAAEIAFGVVELVLRLGDEPHEMQRRRVGGELWQRRLQHLLGADHIPFAEQFAAGVGERSSFRRRLWLHRPPSNGSNGLRASRSSKPKRSKAARMCGGSGAMTLSSPPDGCGRRIARACRWS